MESRIAKWLREWLKQASAFAMVELEIKSMETYTITWWLIQSDESWRARENVLSFFRFFWVHSYLPVRFSYFNIFMLFWIISLFLSPHFCFCFFILLIDRFYKSECVSFQSTSFRSGSFSFFLSFLCPTLLRKDDSFMSKSVFPDQFVSVHFLSFFSSFLIFFFFPSFLISFFLFFFPYFFLSYIFSDHNLFPSCLNFPSSSIAFILHYLTHSLSLHLSHSPTLPLLPRSRSRSIYYYYFLHLNHFPITHLSLHLFSSILNSSSLFPQTSSNLYIHFPFLFALCSCDDRTNFQPPMSGNYIRESLANQI